MPKREKKKLLAIASKFKRSIRILILKSDPEKNKKLNKEEYIM